VAVQRASATAAPLSADPAPVLGGPFASSVLRHASTDCFRSRPPWHVRLQAPDACTLLLVNRAACVRDCWPSWAHRRARRRQLVSARTLVPVQAPTPRVIAMTDCPACPPRPHQGSQAVPLRAAPARTRKGSQWVTAWACGSGPCTVCPAWTAHGWCDEGFTLSTPRLGGLLLLESEWTLQEEGRNRVEDSYEQRRGGSE